MFIPGVIILGCWAAFLLYWLVSAFAVKATAERKSFASSLPYRIPLILGVFIVAKIYMPYPWNVPLTPQTFLTPWIGAATCVIGLGITIWSRWTLAGYWSSDVRFKQGHELVKTGPYRFVRHPIYTGILVMCLAPAIQFGRLHHWLGTLIIGIGLWIKLKQEETVMLQHFPEYSEYQKRVKALVPFVL
ncbi:MAG TPA: isoprenylcysteine carboxylmethyltransferase family protein [Verrucomicrobiae bacterium]|nr:isoprenylcysteine carboxylmethyltransferase family protein [Verrucomicrobiae bacterium]